MRAQKNYQKMLEATIAGLKEQNRVPTLLLHSCCAPCSSYCLEYLSQYFHITVDYYKPNIFAQTGAPLLGETFLAFSKFYFTTLL